MTCRTRRKFLLPFLDCRLCTTMQHYVTEQISSAVSTYAGVTWRFSWVRSYYQHEYWRVRAKYFVSPDKFRDRHRRQTHPCSPSQWTIQSTSAPEPNQTSIWTQKSTVSQFKSVLSVFKMEHYTIHVTSHPADAAAHVTVDTAYSRFKVPVSKSPPHHRPSPQFCCQPHSRQKTVSLQLKRHNRFLRHPSHLII
jgi:hypothetical protein